MNRRLPLYPGLLLICALAACAEDRIADPRREVRGRLLTSTASAATNGKIAFASNRDGNYELYVMDGNGSNQTRLTNTSADEFYPAWSPDGSRIAFSLDNNDIYVMKAGCPNLPPIRLTNTAGFDTDPTWSGDGSKIAFFSMRDGSTAHQIYVMNADGSNQTNVSNSVGTYFDEQPRWSPDGTKIAFSRSGGSLVVAEVFVMNADGSGKVNLTNSPSANDAPLDWSPDGSKILFASNRDNVPYELYVMNADGSGAPVRLTDNGVSEYPASWSPDGTKIVFNPPGIPGKQLWAMDPNGSNQVNLSNNAFNDVFPDWGVPTPTPLDANCDGIDDVLLWPWTGFFAPIDNQPVVNVVKAGSAIPVKFSLSGNRGLAIFAAGYPMSKQVSCSSSLADAVEETVTAGASSLSYDPVADQYVYVWKTDKSWAGTCRQLVLKLADGSTHLADFRLTK